MINNRLHKGIEYLIIYCDIPNKKIQNMFSLRAQKAKTQLTE